MGSVQVLVATKGGEQFTVTASVRRGRHPVPMAVVVHDSDDGTGEVDAIWVASLAAGANRALEVRLTNGPYASVARACAVIEWRGEDGNAGSLHAARRGHRGVNRAVASQQSPVNSQSTVQRRRPPAAT
jgi:hypothetical protein